MRKGKKVAVLGGGLTGLSAAFYLAREAAAQGWKPEITVLEASGRWGGRVNTLHRDRFVIERGPDSFLGRKLAMYRLADELGLTAELTGTNVAARRSFIVHEGRLQPMPKGFNLGIPTDLGALARTSLISPLGKQRVLQDLRIPVREAEEQEESAGDFLERRLGKEMVERMMEPLLAGIHAGDLYKLGLRATFPQFDRLEQEYGSLIRGSIESRLAAAKRGATDAGGAASTEPLPQLVRSSVFLTFRNGLSTLIEALVGKLADMGVTLKLDARVESIVKAGQEGYRLQLADGVSLEADALIAALPAYTLSDLLVSYADVAPLRRINYVSVANVVFGFNRQVQAHTLGTSSGFVVPRTEGRTITACTWTSSKWLHTAPSGRTLLRCYVGRANDEVAVFEDDEQLIARVSRDLQELTGLEDRPDFTEITRLPQSMPQYPIGHTAGIAALRAELAKGMPGLLVTGAAFGGVGLPDCIAQGKEAALQLLNREAGL